MRDEYDFSKGIKNPYVKKEKKQITIRINAETLDYFKKIAEKCGATYQSLINLYLYECVKDKKEITIS
jgi:predicted DNA binding CopG/RHH family protein